MIWLSKIKIYYLIIAVMIVFVIVIILTMMLMWISYFLGQKHLFMAIYTIKAILFFQFVTCRSAKKKTR